jgi:hypothetical protein
LLAGGSGGTAGRRVLAAVVAGFAGINIAALAAGSARVAFRIMLA